MIIINKHRLTYKTTIMGQKSTKAKTKRSGNIGNTLYFGRLLTIILLLTTVNITAQFKTGFEKDEATKLMRATRYPFSEEEKRDSLMFAEIPDFKLIHKVDSIALDNA